MPRNNVVYLMPPLRRPSPLPDADRIANLILAFERAPLSEPTIRAVRGLDGVCRVHVHLAGPDADGVRSGMFSPREARLAARCLMAEQAFPGAGLCAAQLMAEAGLADDDLDPLPRPRRAGGDQPGGAA